MPLRTKLDPVSKIRPRTGRRGPLEAAVRGRSAAMVAALLAAVAAFGVPDVGRAGELEDLRAENAELRRELDAARAQIRELREELASTADAVAAPATASAEPRGGTASAAGEETARTESELVPMRRVSLKVSGDPGASPERLSSEWMPTRDGLRVLDSIKFELVRQGEALSPRLALARTAPFGTISEATTATLRIDGQTYSPTRVGFSQQRQRRRTPRGTSSERQEIAIYALPDGALEQLARARSAQFSAGPTEFVFTDDHVTAAAALAARLGRDGAVR
jgi:hypothetical protein